MRFSALLLLLWKTTPADFHLAPNNPIPGEKVVKCKSFMSAEQPMPNEHDERTFFVLFLTLFHANPIYSWEMQGGGRFCPPCLICLKSVFWGFWWNHLQTVHDCRSHAKEDSQKFKIEDFIAIWKKILNFLKKSFATEKFITQSNLNRFYSSFLQTSSFC